ncbi:MAG: cellulase N-terminal Ig-like domain-containing protein, partial [Gemmatimonadaceae bacterium]
MIHLLLFLQIAAASAASAAAAVTGVIRVNQLGYLPDAPKVAVLCST